MSNFITMNQIDSIDNITDSDIILVSNKTTNVANTITFGKLKELILNSVVIPEVDVVTDEDIPTILSSIWEEEVSE